MNKVIILFSSVLLILVLGWWAWAAVDMNGGHPENKMPESVDRHLNLSEPELAQASATEIEPEYHPVSLPTMFNKEFNGRDLDVGRVLARHNDYTRYYIEYQSGELTISGIMNVPAGDGPWPVLILNHGYIDPAVYTNGRGLKREQDYFARNGYVVIHPDLRNHAGSDQDEAVELNFRLGYIEDVINAVVAVKKSDLPYFDKKNIGMLGHSMGGGVTMGAMVVRPDLVQAASLYAPVSAEIRDNFDEWTRNRQEISDEILARYGLPESGSRFWDDLSPRNFFERVQNPVILHHGDNDRDVPIEWSRNLRTWLENDEVDVVYYEYPGGPHEFINEWPLFMQRNLDFFDKYLK